MKTLNKAAQAYNVNTVTTTPNYNGYPEDLKTALIGFTSFENAEKAANEIGGHIIELSRKYGHDLWTRGGEMFRAFDYTDAGTMFGDNYEVFTDSGEYWKFTREALAQLIEGCQDIEDATDIVASVQETAYKIDALGEGQTALCENYRGIYVYRDRLFTTGYAHDSTTHIIGVIAD
nr:MAG TPA: hypothetical protein [Caudoviricetes sp.]